MDNHRHVSDAFQDELICEQVLEMCKIQKQQRKAESGTK